MGKQVLFGIRNQIFAGSLWFFPCLFIVSIIYDLLQRLCHKLSTRFYKYYLLVLVVILYILGQYLLPQSPSWFFNIDSAFKYILYFGIGSWVFPFLREAKFKSFKIGIKFCVIVLSILAMLFTSIVYFKGVGFIYEKIPMHIPKVVSIFIPVIITLVVVYTNYIAAQFLSNINIFSQIGKETLILCGTEQVLKIAVTSTLSIIGLPLTLPNPLSACIYTFLLLLLSHYTVVPFVDKYIIKKIL